MKPPHSARFSGSVWRLRKLFESGFGSGVVPELEKGEQMHAYRGPDGPGRDARRRAGRPEEGRERQWKIEIP